MSDVFPIKQKIYLHRSKEDNYYLMGEIEDNHGDVLDDDAQRTLAYMGYEVSMNVLINQNGKTYATHLNGVKLEQPVEI